MWRPRYPVTRHRPDPPTSRPPIPHRDPYKNTQNDCMSISSEGQPPAAYARRRPPIVSASAARQRPQFAGLQRDNNGPPQQQRRRRHRKSIIPPQDTKQALPSDAQQWSRDDVRKYLISKDLSAVSELCYKHRICGADLLELTADDLRQMDITALGDIKQTMRVIKRLIPPQQIKKETVSLSMEPRSVNANSRPKNENWNEMSEESSDNFEMPQTVPHSIKKEHDLYRIQKRIDWEITDENWRIEYRIPSFVLVGNPSQLSTEMNRFLGLGIPRNKRCGTIPLGIHQDLVDNISTQFQLKLMQLPYLGNHTSHFKFVSEGNSGDYEWLSLILMHYIVAKTKTIDVYRFKTVNVWIDVHRKQSQFAKQLKDGNIVVVNGSEGIDNDEPIGSTPCGPNAVVTYVNIPKLDITALQRKSKQLRISVNLEIGRNCTALNVSDLKLFVASRHNLNAKHLEVMFKGRQMNNELPLVALNLQQNDILTVLSSVALPPPIPPSTISGNETVKNETLDINYCLKSIKKEYSNHSTKHWKIKYGEAKQTKKGWIVVLEILGAKVSQTKGIGKSKKDAKRDATRKMVKILFEKYPCSDQ